MNKSVLFLNWSITNVDCREAFSWWVTIQSSAAGRDCSCHWLWIYARHEKKCINPTSEYRLFLPHNSTFGMNARFSWFWRMHLVTKEIWTKLTRNRDLSMKHSLFPSTIESRTKRPLWPFSCCPRILSQCFLILMKFSSSNGLPAIPQLSSKHGISRSSLSIQWNSQPLEGKVEKQSWSLRALVSCDFKDALNVKVSKNL